MESNRRIIAVWSLIEGFTAVSQESTIRVCRCVESNRIFTTVWSLIEGFAYM